MLFILPYRIVHTFKATEQRTVLLNKKIPIGRT